MKHLVSLSIIVIAALLFWGSRIWEQKTASTDLENLDPHYVDVFIRDFTMTSMDDNGKPAYILKAKQLKRYNDNDYAVIDEPVIQLTQGDHHWVISANTGEIDETNQHILLNGQVVLLEQDKPEPIRLETEQLEIDTRKQIAKSRQTVRITQQEFNLQSEGMILDNARGQIEFLNSVKGSHASTQ